MLEKLLQPTLAYVCFCCAATGVGDKVFDSAIQWIRFLWALGISDPTLSSILTSLGWYRLKMTTVILFAYLLCDA